MSRVVALFDATPEEETLLRDAAGPELSLDPRDLAAAEFAVVFSFADLPPDIWADARRLRAIVSLPAGADHVPFAKLPARARVLTTHGPNATAIAEHALALLLAAAKRIVTDDAQVRAGTFDQARLSTRIEGARAVVVGAGPIGSETLRLCRALGMRTTCVRASGAPHEHAHETLPATALDDALAIADAAVLAVPLTRSTRGMVGGQQLATMKNDAILVNVARGRLVDRDALASHLSAFPRFAYATDVWWRYPKEGQDAWDEPLARRPNVIGTPHAAGLVPGWRVEMVRRAALALEAMLAGRPPPRSVRAEDPADHDR